MIDSADSLTKTQSSGVLAQNVSVAPMTQRSIARIRRLRKAAGMNSAAATSSPWGVDHAQNGVVHDVLLAAQARDRQMREPEAVLHERRLDLLHPDLVEALHARALVGRLLEHDAVAALFAAELVGAPRFRDQRVEARGRRPNFGETDRAGDRQRVVRALENPARDARQGILRPCLDVSQRAALEEQREDLAAETPIEIVRLRELAELLGDLHQDVLARERPDLLLELAELVGPDVRERANAAAAAGIEPVGQHLEEPPPVIEARRGSLCTACSMSSSGSRASARGRGTLSLTAGSPSTDAASRWRSSGSLSRLAVVATTLIDSLLHWPARRRLAHL